MRAHDQLSRLAASASNDAMRDMARVWAVTSGRPAEAVRDVLLGAVPELVEQYGAEAGALAAEWYEREREAALGSPGRAVVAPVNRDAVVGTVRWAAGDLFEGDTATARRKIDTAIERYLHQASRDTITESARRDSSRVRWARVMRGFETCGWCRMLASRGFVYRSSQQAGAQHAWGHDNCDCEIIPEFALSDSEQESYGQVVDELYDEYMTVWEPGDTDADVAAKIDQKLREEAAE